MKKALVVTHGEDTDGIISGSLLERKLGEKDYFFVSYTEMEKFFKRLSREIAFDKITDEIWFTDLSFNEFLAEGELMRNFLERRVIWIDHHQGTEKREAYLRDLGVEVISERGSCTARLLYSNFFLGNSYAFWLSEIAQAHDYGEGGWGLKIGQNLQKIISLYNWRRDKGALAKLVKRLAKDDRWYAQGKWEEDLRELLKFYNQKEKEAKESLEKSREVVLVEGKRFMFAYGEAFLSPKDALRYLKGKFKGEADNYLVIFGSPKNQVLLSSENSFKTVEFCERWGGGGREKSGGFVLGEVRQDNYSKIKEKIVNSLEGFLKEKQHNI